MRERWPASAPRPLNRAAFRSMPEDFEVHEILPMAPCGEGEHLWLRVRKRGLNTMDVARELSRVAGLRLRDIGYAGLKDRRAVATQWFSLWLPGAADPDLGSMPACVEVLERQRNTGKLRRGEHAANRFRIVLRDLRGDRDALPQVLERIALDGVPNYFGMQRFGHGGSNVARANAMFSGRTPAPRNRHVRGILLSAARAWLFNEALAPRVQEGSWRCMIPGDVAVAADCPSPTGPLWGRGGLRSSGDVAVRELGVASAFPVFAQGLENAGLRQERRALHLEVHDLRWALEPDDALALEFELSPGEYATSVLHELVETLQTP